MVFYVTSFYITIFTYLFKHFQLRRQLRQICPDPSRLALLDPDSSCSRCSQPSTSSGIAGLGGGSGPTSGSYSRLNYVKRMELMKFDGEHRERYCRVMAYNQTHGMLAVSQPSFTALVRGILKLITRTLFFPRSTIL